MAWENTNKKIPEILSKLFFHTIPVKLSYQKPRILNFKINLKSKTGIT